MTKPKAERRIPINRLVKPATRSLLAELAEHLDISEGRTLDRAVQALAVAESFGGNHLRLDDAVPDGVGVQENGQWRVVPRGSVRKGQRVVELPQQETSLDAVVPPAGAKVGKASVEAVRRGPRQKGDKTR